jgi:DNA-binding NarL/FixJ family response regulator
MTRSRTTVVFDRQPLWSEAIARLSERMGVSVVGLASTVPHALSLVQTWKPDVLVAGANCHRPDSEGLAVVRGSRRLSPSTKSVVLAEDDESDHIRNAFAAGASVYCIKTAETGDLASAIRQAFKHSIFLAPDPVPPPTEKPVGARLTRTLTAREREILQLVSAGHPNSQVAQMLWVSEQTIKFHLSNVYRKLGVANRTEASHWAQQHGLLVGGSAAA